ncbi:hypothetical protein G6F68_015425 [Rhizopus microsporus]|nr:hypothetical protein G6F68_015425 [Rhizopus microsporus]
MKRKKKLTLDLSAQEGSSTKKLRINTSGSQVIQEKVPPQEEFDNNFQPPIKSTFNYVASSDPFEGFKKKSGKEKSPANSKKVDKAKRNKHMEEVLHKSATSEQE